MNRTVLWRCIHLCYRAHSYSCAWRRTSQSPVPPSTQLINFGVCSSIITRMLSSASNSSSRNLNLQESNSTLLSTQDSADDVDDVSTEELKKRMDKYYEGDDDEAIPEIFEAILARKLSGKHENSDDELMNELRAKMPHNAQDEDIELDDSDKEEETDGDFDSDDSDEAEESDEGDSDDSS